MEVCGTDCGGLSSASRFLGCLKNVLYHSGLGSGGTFSERPSLTTPLNVATLSWLPYPQPLPPCIFLHPYYYDSHYCIFYLFLLLSFPSPSGMYSAQGWEFLLCSMLCFQYCTQSSARHIRFTAYIYYCLLVSFIIEKMKFSLVRQCNVVMKLTVWAHLALRSAL